jgi:pheromone shutdown-related protein TraB
MDASHIKTVSLNNGDIITLLGTAHISAKSVEEVRQLAHEKEVNAICVEIDSDRLNAMRNPEGWRNLNIHQVLKRKQGFMLLINFALAGFQKRMGEEMGLRPGDDMREAVNVAEELGLEPSLCDRSISITLRRAWAKSSLWGKNKLLVSLLLGVKDESSSKEEIEKLKEADLLGEMMLELSREFPAIKEVLIDERDCYLASKIYKTAGNKRLAVLGAGHLAGVEKWLNALDKGASIDEDELNKIPPPSWLGKMTPYLISFLMISLVIIGFFSFDLTKFKDLSQSWFLSNAITASLAALIALAHPLVILLAFISAPFTAFIPMLSVGMVAGLLQATLVKPRAGDLEDVSTAMTSIKGVYSNRLLRVLLVFFLTTLGGAIGTWLGVWNVGRGIA